MFRLLAGVQTLAKYFAAVFELNDSVQPLQPAVFQIDRYATAAMQSLLKLGQ